MHKFAPFLKLFLGAIAPNPPSSGQIPQVRSKFFTTYGGGPFYSFFSRKGGIILHVGAFFSSYRGLFWACPPPPKMSAGASDNQIIVTAANIRMKMAPTQTQILIFKHNLNFTLQEIKNI